MEISIIWDFGIPFHTDKLTNCAGNLLEWIDCRGGKELCVHPFYVSYFFNTIANKMLMVEMEYFFLSGTPW